MQQQPGAMAAPAAAVVAAGMQQLALSVGPVLAGCTWHLLGQGHQGLLRRLEETATARRARRAGQRCQLRSRPDTLSVQPAEQGVLDAGMARVNYISWSQRLFRVESH